jgi:D-alanine-D-alanine ligase
VSRLDKKSVLIIYNIIEGQKTKAAAFYESAAGVLDEVKAVSCALKELGIAYEVKSIAKIEQLPAILDKSSSQIVFNLVEGLAGSVYDACLVPAVCIAHKKACTGNSSSALLLSLNKWQAKAILTSAGINCPAGVCVQTSQKAEIKRLSKGKYIVKPALTDASEGITGDSVVNVPGPDLKKAVDRILKQLNQPAIVEQYIDGREVNVSVFEQGGKVVVLPLAEIDFSAFASDKPRIVDYSAKWLTDSFEYKNTPRIIPAKFSKNTESRIREAVLASWFAVGCEGYARVDLRVDKKGTPFVLEVNPNPDISADAGFAAALGAANISYSQFIKSVLDDAIINKVEPRRHKGAKNKNIFIT